MKVPKSYEGKLVGMHLARPVYMFEYGAHVKLDGVELITPAPVIKSNPDGTQGAALSEVLMGALVVAVEDDSVAVDLFVPDRDGKTGIIVRKLIPSAIILSVDTVEQFNVEMPQVTQQKNRATPSLIVPP